MVKLHHGGYFPIFRDTMSYLIMLWSSFVFILPFIGQYAGVVQSTPQQVDPLLVSEQALWEAGMAGVSLYRIPVISYTPNGNLIAAVEARKYSGGDAGPKFLAVRRSTDGGYKWSPQQFILDDGSMIFDGINLGVIVVDDITASIFIFFGLCSHYNQCGYFSLHYVKSVDDGITWQKPVNVSEQVGSKMFGPGPGYGIQKKYPPHRGRLIVCGHSTMEANGVFCLLSDDHGQLWRNGGALLSIPYNLAKQTGDFTPSECQPVEMPDGSIFINARNQNHFRCNCRITARSYDGGETIPVEYVTIDPALNDSAVAGGLLYHNGVMFFSNPNNSTKRVDMTLKWSYDNGTTWTGQLQIWPKAAAYSAMTTIPGGVSAENYIFVIYEKGDEVGSQNELVSVVKIRLH